MIYDIEDNLLVEIDGLGFFRMGVWSGNWGKVWLLIVWVDYVVMVLFFMVDCYCVLNVCGVVLLIYLLVDIDVFCFWDWVLYFEWLDGWLVIGWIGMFSFVFYFDLLWLVFCEFVCWVDYMLIVIGNFFYSLLGVDLEVLIWLVVDEVVQMQWFDIGVYLLLVDDWVLGKVGLKVIQYMVFGLLSVLMNIGIVMYQVCDGVDGFLVDGDDQWLVMFECLCCDVVLCDCIGVVGWCEVVV